MAASRIGTAAAGVNLGAQPAECNRRLLDPARTLDKPALTLVDEYDAVLDAANDRLQNCYSFNQAIRAGLVGN